MKTIVISAVNIRRGGTLTILKQCLAYLSSEAPVRQWRIVAIVHKRALCDYQHIEYIEMPEVAQSWGRRLWCEYVTMHRISKQLAPVDLWFSLHDTSPRVHAQRQAVYCQTSFPFLKWKLQDLRFDPKIVLFALFTRFAYRINIHANYRLVVQAVWLRQGFSKMFRLPSSKFIVSPPQKPELKEIPNIEKTTTYQFFFPSTPDCHKNFELACQAAALLEQEIGNAKFRLVITVQGDENKYAKWLHEKWGATDSICFAGYLSKEQLYRTYAQSDCLVYPSRVETWGLAISEFGILNKPCLIADMPYAHETAAGNNLVAFFNADNPYDLKEKMRAMLQQHHAILAPVPQRIPEQPIAENWESLFRSLLE